MQHGRLLAIGENKVLQLVVPDESDEPEPEGSIFEFVLPDDSGDDPTMEASESAGADISEPKRQIADWPEAATKLLITNYQELKPLVENRKIKSMKRMWQKICEELDAYDYKYTCTQVESKWKSLERSFKTVMENSKKTGRGRKSCPYER